MRIPGRRVFQAEGTSAKVFGQETALCVPGIMRKSITGAE